VYTYIILQFVVFIQKYLLHPHTHTHTHARARLLYFCVAVCYIARSCCLLARR